MLESILGTSPTKEEILKRVADDQVEFVNLQFTDVMGIVKSVTIPASILDHIIDGGQWIDGSSIAGFTRIAESDMYLLPDLSTYAVIPWERGEFTTARIICWVHSPNGDQFPGDPRWALLRQLERLAELGYTYKTGPELEFFLFSKTEDQIAPLPHDRGGYFDLSTDLASTVRKDMVKALAEMGIDVEASHHEVATGQHEIDFEYGDAIATGDRAVTFKYVLKAIAQKHGLHATFMPKPLAGINGSGMHCHQSFAAIDGGGNAFVDEEDAYGLSKVAKHFIAGLLQHAAEITAVTNQWVNSYKRLWSGGEAPPYVCWGSNNRSALVRVPMYKPKKSGSTRIEVRSPDSATNPYLCFAVMLAAGMKGIEEGYELPAEAEDDVWSLSERERKALGIRPLPKSLYDAIGIAESSELLAETLGEHVFDFFLRNKRAEWEEYRTQVSAYERDRMLPVL